MIKLYFDKQLVDIKENIEIALTYEMNDLSNPEAVKSSYSKTVKLEGTTTNNTIFSHIYRLDKSILDSNTNLIGLNFNPNKRVPYYIELNGEVIDSGFFQLDNINCNSGAIEYEVTLYGGIGDFFYNLMYDDNEEDKTLGSLYYGIDGMTKEQEEKNLNLFEYNKDYVKECWKRRTEGNVNTNSKYEMFCPIPSHSGLYDDFSSNTVLTNETNGIPEYIADETKSFGKTDGFAKVTTPRELSEWEIGDLRSHYQRLGVKMSSIYNAIKDPVNNGGYEVDDSKIDEHSKNYIANGYVMLDRFDYDTINQTNKVIPITLSKNPLTPQFNNKDVAYSQTIDVSEFVNPHMTVSIVPQVKVTSNVWGNQFTTFFTIGETELKGTDRVDLDSYWDWDYQYETWEEYKQWIIYGWKGRPAYGSWQVYYARMMDKNGNTLKISKPIIYGSYKTDDKYLYSMFEISRKRLLQETGKYFPELGYSTNEADYNLNYLYNLNKNDLGYQKNVNVGTDIGRDFVAPDNIHIETDIPKNCTQVRLESFTVGTGFVYNAYFYPVEKHMYQWTAQDLSYMVKWPDYSPPLETELTQWNYITGYLLDWNKYYAVGMTDTNAVTYDAYGNVNNTAENISQIYDGVVSTSSRRHVLNKQQIFAETKTPFDYLISMGKMFNWVFEKDVVSNTIRIYSKYNYYDKVIKDISNDIDRTTYAIRPSTIEYNSYRYNVPLPDTYQTDLFRKKNNRIYSQFVYKPNYQFNSESYEVLEDSSYTIAMPYRMHSIYFSPIDNLATPKVTMGNKFTVTLWQMYGGNETKDQDLKGQMLTSKSIVDSNDASDKICCFDKENASVGECSNVFVLYNGNVWGYSDHNENILYLSDDAPIIDSLCDGNAYIMTQGQAVNTSLNSPDKAVIQDRIWIYPSFGIADVNGYSLSFNEEGNKKNLWDLFHKNDVINIYNKDSKILKIKYRLKEQPYKALRHFYYIDNAIWILNNINDYKPNDEGFTECEFIKLIDVNNYCKPNL